MKGKSTIILLIAAFTALMSLPWLIPHTAVLALLGFVPLLCAERLAGHCGIRHFFLWHYSAFVLWNAATTFWVCNATVGGGLFAIFANAFQMALIFEAFRFSRKKLGGCLPYIFLVCCWIAWERFYFSAEISWPWLTLGNALAGTPSLAQWYSITGTEGGSLWILICSLSVFGLMTRLSDGRWSVMTPVGRAAAVGGTAAVLLIPIAVSLGMYYGYEEKCEGRISVATGQPNFDPYEKFRALSQDEQTEILLDLLKTRPQADLYLAPETFTGNVILGNVESGRTWNAFRNFLDGKDGSSLVFGASTYTLYESAAAPSPLARKMDGGWFENHNSALVLDGSGRTEVCNKGKLVVGVEKMPYPRLLSGLDDRLGGVMGRCVGPDEPSVLHLSDGTTFGCAICYESVYGEYCAEFIRKGSGFLAVITNDAWWGDTPGYRQHLNYSALRAIETRRDLARCANTGISAFINQRGDIVSSTRWWQREILCGEVNVNREITPFVRYGDVTGKACTLAFLLLLLLLTVRCLQKRVG